MQPLLDWLTHWRPILEAIYFLSGIVLVFGVWTAVKQLRITKDIADIGVRREAAKLATDQCRYLAEQVVPACTALMSYYQASHMTCLQRKAQANIPYLVQMSPDGEFINSNYDAVVFQQEWANIGGAVVGYLNKLEYFSMPLAAGVASEKVAYPVAIAPFIEGVNFCIVAIHYLRSHNLGRFQNTIKLYTVWQARQLLASLPGIQNLARGNEIRILGGERRHWLRQLYVRLWLRFKPELYD